MEHGGPSLLAVDDVAGEVPSATGRLQLYFAIEGTLSRMTLRARVRALAYLAPTIEPPKGKLGAQGRSWVQPLLQCALVRYTCKVEDMRGGRQRRGFWQTQDMYSGVRTSSVFLLDLSHAELIPAINSGQAIVVLEDGSMHTGPSTQGGQVPRIDGRPDTPGWRRPKAVRDARIDTTMRWQRWRRWPVVSHSWRNKRWRLGAVSVFALSLTPPPRCEVRRTRSRGWIGLILGRETSTYVIRRVDDVRVLAGNVFQAAHAHLRAITKHCMLLAANDRQ